MKIVLKKPARLALVGNAEMIKEWREQYAEYVDGYRHMPSYKNSPWDGKSRPGSINYSGMTATLYLRRGWLNTLYEDFGEPELKVECDLPPQLPIERLDEYDLPYDLRDYQRQAIEQVAEAYWGRVAYATNAGKGAVIALLSKLAREQDMKVAVFADEVSVYQALEEEIEEWAGFTPDHVEAGRDDPPNGDVTLAMVPTLHTRVKDPDDKDPHPRREEWIEWLNSLDMVLLDEADRATADRWKTVLKHCKNSHYRVGFSGSFDTHNDLHERNQMELMGPVLKWVKNIQLVKRGISVKPEVMLHPYRHELPKLPIQTWYDMSGPQRRKWAYERGVIENFDRHELVQDLIVPDVQNAVIVQRVRHGEILTEEVLEDSVYLYGDDSKSKRLEVLDRFEQGEFRTLVATKILDRGTNLLGHAQNLIFVSGAGSKTQTLQRIGRGLRQAEGKHKLRLHDIIDLPPNGYNPDAKVDPYRYFVNSTEKRIDLYHNEGFEVTIND